MTGFDRSALCHRPAEMGQAWFCINHQLVNIDPHRNHSHWLLAHDQQLGLPAYIHNQPHRALWESYKLGAIRIVWDPQGGWLHGAAAGNHNVLYICGFRHSVWREMRTIMHAPVWCGVVNSVVIEYVRDCGGQPQWYHSQTVHAPATESLYRGRQPRTQLAPPNAVYGGESDPVINHKYLNIAA